MNCIAGIACCLTLTGAFGQCVPGWSPVGLPDVGGIKAIGSGTDPQGRRYLVAGNGPWPGGVWWRPATWDGWAWGSMHGGLGQLGDDIRAILFWPTGTPGSVLPGAYVGGFFSTIGGGTPAQSVARWDGQQWHDVGGGPPGIAITVYAMKAYDEDGPGPAPPVLYAGGAFAPQANQPAAFARWDGQQWLYPSQQPTQFSQTNWPAVYALEVYDDDGPGPRRPGLYVAGNFKGVGSTPVQSIARWDGQAWETFGDVAGTVDALCVFDDDGPGPRPPALFVGGDFDWVAGNFYPKLARWDGQQWSVVGVVNGISSTVVDLKVFDDDGPGPNPPALFLTGYFTVASTTVNRVAKYNGFGLPFQALGSGLTGGVGFASGRALATFDEDGPGPNPGGLYVAGNFTFAGGVPSNYIARWGCPLAPRCPPDCNNDGVLNLADFGCFQTKFALQDPYADCNGDGSLNLADFGCFQTKFALGCP